MLRDCLPMLGIIALTALLVRAESQDREFVPAPDFISAIHISQTANLAVFRRT